MFLKILKEAEETDLSFANEDKKFEEERIKIMYKKKIAEIDKQLALISIPSPPVEVNIATPKVIVQPRQIEPKRQQNVVIPVQPPTSSIKLPSNPQNSNVKYTPVIPSSQMNSKAFSLEEIQNSANQSFIESELKKGFNKTMLIEMKKAANLTRDEVLIMATAINCVSQLNNALLSRKVINRTFKIDEIFSLQVNNKGWDGIERDEKTGWSFIAGRILGGIQSSADASFEKMQRLDKNLPLMSRDYIQVHIKHLYNKQFEMTIKEIFNEKATVSKVPSSIDGISGFEEYFYVIYLQDKVVLQL